jgi:hypothetical protein
MPNAGFHQCHQDDHGVVAWAAILLRKNFSGLWMLGTVWDTAFQVTISLMQWW